MAGWIGYLRFGDYPKQLWPSMEFILAYNPSTDYLTYVKKRCAVANSGRASRAEPGPNLIMLQPIFNSSQSLRMNYRAIICCCI